MTRHVALIGAGIGAQHLDAYRKLSDIYTVQVICDLDQDRARTLLTQQDDITITGDFEAVLADPAIDIIDICLPPHLHLSACEEALAAGKHVICEKPLVRSPAEADRLSRAMAASGKQVFPVFQYRYGPEAAKLRALQAAGLVGKPLVATVETHWNRTAEYYDIDWRGTWAGESGGAVLGHAIHNHDFVAMFMGEIRQVMAMTDTRVNDIEVEDCAAIVFRTNSGALVTSSVTLGAADEITRFRFVYDNLTVESDLAPYSPATGTWVFKARDPKDQRTIDAAIATVKDTADGFIGLFAEIDQVLSGQSNNAVSFAAGQNSIELVAAIYHAARTGKAVSLPLSATLGVYENWAP